LEVADQPVKIEPQHLAGKTQADVVDAKTEIALVLLRLFRRQCSIIQHDANTIAGRLACGHPLSSKMVQHLSATADGGQNGVRGSVAG
jgi:hypothetical protein